MKHIQILLASSEPGEMGEAVAHWVLDTLSALRGVTLELVDLNDWLLPAAGRQADGWSSPRSELPAVVVVLAKQEAGGFALRHAQRCPGQLTITYGEAEAYGRSAPKLGLDGQPTLGLISTVQGQLHLPLPQAARALTSTRELLSHFAPELVRAVSGRLKLTDPTLN